MGPLIVAFLSLTKPKDIHLISFTYTGKIWIEFLEFFNFSPYLLTRVGNEGPYISESNIPTLYPCFLSPNAIFTAMVLFPTPPLQLETAIIFFTPDKLPFL